ncbi:hypothetical protein [Fluviispira multicolorata]|uniref:Uncharacterized protein n=1 Tax=Fluviispira multicolorata TaxID=2654512 RepID=A0A833N4U8_9BACT|nr:hypothetical protein [Fluviispira multicolorata]KAB8029063.1 hypothetical protein GCL57_11015 [Fluviispira multicolorata]
MKLKCALLLLSVMSSTTYAKTYNLNTVINSQNINQMIDAMVKTFDKGSVDPTFPVGISGTYDLDDNNRLVSINVEHASFRVVKIPLIGTYQTDLSISGKVEAGNCGTVTLVSHKVNSGSPEIVNPLFNERLKVRGAKALEIGIKESGLKAYCIAPKYNLFFY